MNPIDLETARQLIDYTGGDDALESLADIQIKGAVALQNRICDPEIGLAYLADEVGMGKTYIALGVVAIMRYFNPMLRVLYICPSRNVQEKWVREYKAFIRTNVRVSQGRIRTREGKPAAPYQSCRNVVDLLHDAASGYYADFFIGKDSFSISISDDVSVWERKRDELKALIPAHEWKGIIKSKYDVKEQYARALNYILPTFDLVVIDEAHNFKHDFQSSDRNRVLSGVLGFREEDGYFPRARHALMLSATPYDRNLNQLRNQLKMVGRLDLLPEEMDDNDKPQMTERLRNFLVRRLNTLKVNGDDLTRNMYRREWRKGPKAEILLESDEQKLVTALVQKKVGEMLTRQSGSPSFQMGLLASFESFAESTRSEPVQFDGDKADKKQSDARDRHVIGQLVDNYIDYGLGRTLPHPKMDSVVKRLGQAMFNESKKQIVFVRRVKSVNEIKDKLDDAYNRWISGYIDDVLKEHEEPKAIMAGVYASYLEASRKRDKDLLGGEFDRTVDTTEEELPPKNDTFFAWFFRGALPKEAATQLAVTGGEFPSPESVRNGLAAKNQVIVNLLEPNWAWYLCRREGLDLTDILAQNGEDIAAMAGSYITGDLTNYHYELFHACQTAFVRWLVEYQGLAEFKPLYEHMVTSYSQRSDEYVNKDKLANQLSTETLYTELESVDLGDAIVPMQAKLYEALKSGKIEDELARFEIHKTLMSFVLRTAHGIIDIYLARLKQGPGNLTVESRTQWIRDFVVMLSRQKESRGFTTWHELVHLGAHMELIIKNSIPEILEKSQGEYRKVLSNMLNPVSPVIGASGETSGRSAQARKFRMPGYPLALVTTDVFQEGEDLHTFCDSVVHYGLSGSPVSLEQKTGRVDRVGAMAQRRLMALERQAEEDDYIQVTFPYVKESIEALQIRQICRNINEFIKSLHDVVPGDHTVADIVDVERAMFEKEEVPEQILTPLKSPYDPTVEVANEFRAVEEVEENDRRRTAEIAHLMNLIDNKIEGSEQVYHLQESDVDIPAGKTAIRLGSARASGELLLSLSCQAESGIYRIDNKTQLLELMCDLSWTTFHRTFVTESSDAKNSYHLYFNAEMLVGGEGVTQRCEIDRLFERMKIKHNPQGYCVELPDAIRALIDSINEDTPIPVDRTGGTRVRVTHEAGVTTLLFEFGGLVLPRTQRISLFSSHERVVFLSHATRAGFCKELDARDIIKYTWMRNRHIDLVEFVVDPSQAITGRVVHPSEEMQWEEFIYCAYTLAVETDNLEYLLSKHDIL
ncbi:helicase [Ectothiorhodospiraceae bacterium BW-2]|nr:helicase [Ectothiorhodospiraceae bacterium BW-2]